MTAQTLAKLKTAPGAELEELADRCGHPALARKLQALASYPRAFHPTSDAIPGWLAGFVADLLPDEASRLEDIVAGKQLAAPPEPMTRPGSPAPIKA